MQWRVQDEPEWAHTDTANPEGNVLTGVPTPSTIEVRTRAANAEGEVFSAIVVTGT